MVILQMFFAFFGYGMSKLPYLLHPFVKITGTHVNPEMGLAFSRCLYFRFTFINSIVNIIIKIICFRQRLCRRKEII